MAYLTSVEAISVVTLIRTDSTLDYSQEAASMAMAMAMLQITYEILYASLPLFTNEHNLQITTHLLYTSLQKPSK